MRDWRPAIQARRPSCGNNRALARGPGLACAPLSFAAKNSNRPARWLSEDSHSIPYRRGGECQSITREPFAGVWALAEYSDSAGFVALHATRLCKAGNRTCNSFSLCNVNHSTPRQENRRKLFHRNRLRNKTRFPPGLWHRDCIYPLSLPRERRTSSATPTLPIFSSFNPGFHRRSLSGRM